MEGFNFKAARTFAMELGLRCGIVWIASFLLFVLSFPSMWAELAMMIGLSSVALIGFNLRRARKMNASLNVLRCWWISWFSYLCGVLLTTAAQYFYFAVIDKGELWMKLESLFRSDVLIQAYRELGAESTLEQLQRMASEMHTLPVRDVVMSLMMSNLFIGFVFGALSLLFIVGTRAGESRNLQS